MMYFNKVCQIDYKLKNYSYFNNICQCSERISTEVLVKIDVSI